MSVHIAIVYHSGYGHTEKLAYAIADGIRHNNVQLHVLKADALTDNDWATLDMADAVVFGAPTYMGGPSAPFKAFADATSGRWFEQKWRDKIAAGFTNSASYSGDKLATLQQFHVLAMQHGMIWIGQAEPAPSFDGTDIPDHNMINRLGSFSGLMSQSNHKAGPDIAPPAGDLETARRFGKRITALTLKFKS